ncbi:hypothetical protein MTR67_026019 [Solanum verrucosum]|uniref:Reverse transcriptase domain-containing protein n=1 Tax=Solanum verrucosum TaxID=315347 RepID=A0AAF0TUE5_SOLVR|nr:hypothetical protein MTR67_026019 [Solanum verrucosum]
MNGNPVRFFQSQRRLRQGDPMSPFQFLRAMKGLNQMIRTAKSNGWIRGFGVLTEVGVAGETSHLLYADDSLVFCEAESFAKNLGCQVGTLPTKYLGIPLGAKRKSVDSWNEVIERCDKKLGKVKSPIFILREKIDTN